MILFYFPVYFLLLFFGATKIRRPIGFPLPKQSCAATKMSISLKQNWRGLKNQYFSSNNKKVETFHHCHDPYTKYTCNKNVDAILWRNQIVEWPGHNINIANKQCVFNYLPLHVTIDPFIIIFSQISILLLFYHDHYSQEKKAHSAPLSSLLWWSLLSASFWVIFKFLSFEPNYSWWQSFPIVD